MSSRTIGQTEIQNCTITNLKISTLGDKLYHYQIVEEALDGLPPIEYFYNNSALQNERIFTRVIDMYDKNSYRMSKLPEKQEKEVRPIFVNDYINAAEEMPRNGREALFVSRSLIYSDSVAVLDRLYIWSNLRRQEGGSPVGAGLGDMRCPNGVADILQIVRYADYEKHGLVHYYRLSDGFTPKSYIDEAQTEFREMGIGDPDPLAFLKYQKYWLGLSELFKALGVVGQSGGELDLYLPRWTLPDFTLDWLFKRIEAGLSYEPGSKISKTQVDSARSIHRIMSIPAPNWQEFDALSARELADVRQKKFFREFRNDIDRIADDFSTDTAISDLQANDVREKFDSKIISACDSFIDKFGFSGFGWRSSIQKGVVIGGIGSSGTATFASLNGADVYSSTALSVIPAIAEMVGEPIANFLRWFISERSAFESTKLHYRAFMSD